MGRVTLPARWPRSAALSDYASTCDICGVPWRRSQLRYDTRGFLVCPLHGKGRDPAELSLLNAESAEQWSAELASRPPRDEPMDPVHIARDPRAIFGSAVVLFDVDPEEATAVSGLVPSLPDANGSAATLTTNGGYTGFRYTLQDDSFGGFPTLGCESTGTTGHTMRTTAVSSALPVAYWGLLKVHKWRPGAALIRSNANACVLATGTANQTFTIRGGSTTTTEIEGPGQETWFRFYAQFTGSVSTLQVGPRTMTASVGSAAMSALLDFIAMPGGGDGSQYRIGRFLAMTGTPTSDMLTEADEWARSRFGGRFVSL